MRSATLMVLLSGPQCQIGPYARLRPGAELGEQAKVGNFVEIKNSVLGPGAKANHLAYVGDASVGADANIGAGTITCNYDGANKHRTELGKNVFIGSNSTLVAPLKVEDDGFVAAGSTVTATVGSGAACSGSCQAAQHRRLEAPSQTKEIEVIMCGIVAAAAQRGVSGILLEGLRRLEYRGYDSAGMALIDAGQALQLHKHAGKVKNLEDANARHPILGHRGVAHTRWATHGELHRPMRTHICQASALRWSTTASLKITLRCVMH